MTSETDEQFLRRIADYGLILGFDVYDIKRLRDLARRGAAVQEGSEQARLLRDKIGFPLPPPPAGETSDD